MMNSYKWRLVSDEYLQGVFFAVAPITGHLFEISNPSDINNSVILKHFFGLNPKKYAETICDSCNLPIEIPPVEKPISKCKLRYIQIIRRVIDLALMIVPLGFVINLVSIFTPVNLNKFDLKEALSIVAHAFSTHSNGNCLQIAICRYWLFRKLGWSTSIHLGVLFPTEEMHAWVTLQGQPIFECPDFIAHYQTAVIYSY